MTKKELNEMSVKELGIKLKDNQDSLLNLRFQKSLGQLEHPREISNVKKEIAQIKTVLNEFNLGIRGKKVKND
tara:strand:+ start:1513 stop:1731 length:219 start_codon:yes stop_codon:yes gene_type:complete